MIQSYKKSQQFFRILTVLITLFISSTSAQGAWIGGKVTIFILSDASDKTLKQEPIVWAIEQLQNAFKNKDIEPGISYNTKTIHETSQRIIITYGISKQANEITEQAGVTIPKKAESLALIKGRLENEPVIMVTGSDNRGLVYGILELADRVTYCDDPISMLDKIENSVEQPANSIRSVARLFVSEVEDKSWFYDKTFWLEYLSMLMTQRFNRFSLTLGLGYDSPKEVVDSYFIFAYPYLVTVSGFDVNVKGLPLGEREKNLEMLQFISIEAARRGLHFQLGLWGHAYECENSSSVNYIIQGLTKETHAEYCRNAIRTLLQACPNINGITFRAHYESGIPDGSKSFWETVFQGVAECGRQVEIDLHAKGISYSQIEMALNTGLPVLVSPKLSSEHMALPAHQASIREVERVPSAKSDNPRNSISRYSYSDFLSNDRKYGIVFRIWPGMQKILLWGDPELASGYSRYAGFCGSLGIEVCDPLCFKGRQGSGISPERRIYADNYLIPDGGDWHKYLYTYRIWGRHLYNPDVNPESYRRYLRNEFGEASLSVEKSLSSSSKIIPLITSAHLPAVSAMTYWPEMYTNMSITNSGIPHPYGDTPTPKVFGRVSPSDPAMFSPINEFVDDFVSGKPSTRYSAIDVALWLENFSITSTKMLELAKQQFQDNTKPIFRRMYIDASIQNAIGMFFANKFRAATAYMIYEKNNDLNNLRDAIYFYKLACNSWKDIIKLTDNVYVNELGFGRFPHIRGHWKDRFPAIEQDFNVMVKLLKDKMGESFLMPEHASSDALKWLQVRPQIPSCEHQPQKQFVPGKPLEIALNSINSQITNVKIYYRHVNQAEAYNIQSMEKVSGVWRVTLPSEFTDSNYPLMYYFEIQNNSDCWLFPGFAENLANQPYFSVMQAN